MRVGIYGGTFDPIHFGHLITSMSVLEIRGLDKIIFIPCHVSPHKLSRNSASAPDRLNMLKLAIEGSKYFDYSSIELERGGISYTADTLSILKEQYEEMELIIGYDNLKKFHTWRDPENILRMAKILVMRRITDMQNIEPDKFTDSIEIINTPNIEISSTLIRQRRSMNLPIDYYVPENVASYIYSKNLYK